MMIVFKETTYLGAEHMLAKTIAIELLEAKLQIELSTFKKAAQEVVIELAEKIETVHLSPSSLSADRTDFIHDLGKPDLIALLSKKLQLESEKLNTLAKTQKYQLASLVIAIS